MVALFYVWIGCYEIGGDTDNFRKMFIRTLEEDTKEEDGWSGSPIDVNADDGKEDVATDAHPQRKRKRVLASNNPQSPSRGNNSSLDKLTRDIAEGKKTESNPRTKTNARNTMLANMLVSPRCPEELKPKLHSHFDDGIVDEAVLESKM
jgi:hypothetical protein